MCVAESDDRSADAASLALAPSSEIPATAEASPSAPVKLARCASRCAELESLEDLSVPAPLAAAPAEGERAEDGAAVPDEAASGDVVVSVERELVALSVLDEAMSAPTNAAFVAAAAFVVAVAVAMVLVAAVLLAEVVLVSEVLEVDGVSAATSGVDEGAPAEAAPAALGAAPAPADAAVSAFVLTR